VWLVACLAGLLISTKWQETRRVAIMSVLVLVLSGWSMYEMAHFLWGLHLPARITDAIQASSRPVLGMYLLYLGPVLLSVAAPVFLILKKDGVLRFTRQVYERIYLLSGFYLVLDLAAVAIVLSRNLK